MIDVAITQASRAKVERARMHIDELVDKINPLCADFFEITIDQSAIFPGYDNPGIYVHYRPKTDISQALALIIGDAVHNLRSALDHLCTSICRTVENNAKPFFPADPDRAKAFDAKYWPLLEKALPGVKERFFSDVRPKEGSSEGLWNFVHLDNEDKHNLLIPTVTIASIQGLKMSTKHGVQQDNIYQGDANQPYGIAGFTNYTRAEVKITGKVVVTVHAKFGDGNAFAGHEITPTLSKAANLVLRTIEFFEEAIVTCQG